MSPNCLSLFFQFDSSRIAFFLQGIGLFPSRIIDSWSQQIFFSFFFFGQIIGKLTRITSDITIILYYARVISKRQGRKNLEDPNDLIPLQQSKEDLNKPKEAPVEGQKPVQEGEEQANHNNNDDIHQEEVTQALETDNLEGSCGLIDVWKDDQEIVLYEKEINRLRTAQEKLCHSQTWYRPHSSATHYVSLDASITLTVFLLPFFLSFLCFSCFFFLFFLVKGFSNQLGFGHYASQPRQFSLSGRLMRRNVGLEIRHSTCRKLSLIYKNKNKNADMRN